MIFSQIGSRDARETSRGGSPCVSRVSPACSQRGSANRIRRSHRDRLSLGIGCDFPLNTGAGGVCFCVSQNIAIQQRQYDVQGKVGAVWNEVDRASQLLQQDAALLNATISSQNEAITKIAQARSNATTIKASQGTTDTNAALAAAGQMTAGIRVFVENYPDYGVGSNSHSVLVQIEGSFNRIEYARAQLIKEQTDFNKWLLTQIPMNLFYHPVQILGSNANPAEPVPVPHYVQPTPSL